MSTTAAATTSTATTTTTTTTTIHNLPSSYGTSYASYIYLPSLILFAWVTILLDRMESPLLLFQPEPTTPH